jgi:hypothetical protein
MLITKLSFALLLCGNVLFAESQAIRPTQKVTEVEKIDQHLRVQDEIYQNLSKVLPNTGVDSCASGTKVVRFSPKYPSATTYVPLVSVRGYALADTGKVCVAATTDSSFTVFGSPATVKFYWTTIGVKK